MAKVGPCQPHKLDQRMVGSAKVEHGKGEKIKPAMTGQRLALHRSGRPISSKPYIRPRQPEAADDEAQSNRTAAASALLVSGISIRAKMRRHAKAAG